MKKALLLLLVMLCFALQGQGTNMVKPSLSADNKRWEVWQPQAINAPLNGNRCYQIRYVSDNNDAFRRGYILFLDGKTSFASLKLPLTDDECKNFSVDSLMQTKRGFMLIVTWGGGKYLYTLKYIVRYRQASFFLDSIITQLYEPEKGRKKTTYKRMKKPLEMKGMIALPELLD